PTRRSSDLLGAAAGRRRLARAGRAGRPTCRRAAPRAPPAGRARRGPDRAVSLERRGRRERRAGGRGLRRAGRGAAGRAGRLAGGTSGRKQPALPRHARRAGAAGARRCRGHGRRRPVRPARRGAGGRPVIVSTPRYRLEVADDGLFGDLTSPEGELWLRLRPHAAVDATDAPDETLALEPPRLVGDRVVELRRRSTRWDEAVVRLVCTDDALEVETSVSGQGALATARLLALRSLLPGHANGLLPSGSRLTSLFSPNPDRPQGPVRPAAEGATLGVVGDSEPGRGRWLFTPPPLYLCLDHVGISVVAPVEELRFAELVFEGGDGAFALAFEYDGHLHVDRTLELPRLVLTPGVEDPYEGLRAHRTLLTQRGVAPEPAPRERPAWWSEPIFCGWGAQCARAAETGQPASALATEAEYETYLGALEREGLVPGVVVLDDKW